MSGVELDEWNALLAKLAAAEAERDRWEDQAAELALACNAIDAKLERYREALERIAEAALWYGNRSGNENESLPHDETDDPHDRTECRTCALEAAIDAWQGALAAALNPTPERSDDA